MKTRVLFVTVLLIGVAAWLPLAFAQSKRHRAAKEFMRDKLELSKRVLEGVATEDYDLIVAQGIRLSAMTKEADWRLFENPDYEQQSTVFRRHVDSLVKAARNKDLDAATLAYVRMTMSCVDCHRLVRGKLVASAEGFAPSGDSMFEIGLATPSPRKGNERASGLTQRSGWPAAHVTTAINGRTTAIRQN
jgi:cytochrome c556